MHLPYNYLYMWGCTSVDIVFFFFFVGIYSSRFRIRGIERQPLLFHIAFSFQRFWLINFLLAHVYSSESEIRGIEMLCFFFLFALPLPSLVAFAAACTTQSSTAVFYSASLVSKRSLSCLRKSVTVIQVSWGHGQSICR